MIPEVTPTELSRQLESGPRPVLLDVREAYELEISSLNVDHHIPLGELPRRLNELDPASDIVIICRSGARSGRAAEFLMAQGFSSVRNLVRGMNGWSAEVDPRMPAY